MLRRCGLRRSHWRWRRCQRTAPPHQRQCWSVGGCISVCPARLMDERWWKVDLEIVWLVWLSSKQTKKLIFKRRGSPVVIDLIAFQFFPLLLESLVNLILGWPKTAGARAFLAQRPNLWFVSSFVSFLHHCFRWVPTMNNQSISTERSL